MKPIEVTDELLYKYMPIADEMEWDALEADLDDKIEFSEKFQKKMKRLMWREKHRWLIDFGKFIGKVAVVVLCILGVSLAVTMSVDAYRSKIFQTVQAFLDDSVKHTYDTGEEEQGFVPHEPTYIPEGYVEIRRLESGTFFSIEYENEKEEYIHWDQSMVSQGTWNALDSEYSDQTLIKMDEGFLVIYYYDTDFIRAYYETEQYVYVLTVDNLEENEIYQIFESIK